jgi:hypothetical protein
MTITTIYGSKGQGKSAIATYIAYETYRSGDKSKIVANYKLSFPFEPLDFRNLESYQNALVVFDEAHLYADNRTSQKKLNRLISYFVFEIRHLNTDLILVSQQESIDKRLRNATDIILLPHALVLEDSFTDKTAFGKSGYRDKIDDDERIELIRIDMIDIAHDREKKLYLNLHELSYDLFSLYDSTALIPFSSESLEKFF